MKESASTSVDLKKFIEKFDPTKFKQLPDGIEIRGLGNIHHSIQMASELITRLKLKLRVVHNADMLTYGAFEVRVA